MITRETIQNDVATYTGHDISQPFRKTHLVLGRQMYYTLCREFTDNSLQNKGKIKESSGQIRRFNHAGVLNLLNKFDSFMVRHKMHHETYKKLRNHYLNYRTPYFDFEGIEHKEPKKLIKTHTRKDLNTLVSLNQ